MSERLRSKGIASVLGKMITVPLRTLRDVMILLYRRLLPTSTFEFNGTQLAYCYQWYNTTWRNERAIEIPLGQELLCRYAGKRILEIGNTLAHYGVIHHDVLDKYETGTGVINQDVATFIPQKPYEVVISISTMEHVGWDETPREPEKLLSAIEHVQAKMMQANGVFLMTVPIGYNSYLDEALRSGALKPSIEQYFGRITRSNYWVPISKAEALTRKYGAPFSNANAILLATFSNP